MKENYRDIIEIVELMHDLKDLLKIEQVPHFTTIYKFMGRIRALYHDIVLIRVIHLFYTRETVISITAIDSSGLTSSHARSYYSWRTGKVRRSYLKIFTSVDMEKRVITGIRISRSLCRIPSMRGLS